MSHGCDFFFCQEFYEVGDGLQYAARACEGGTHPILHSGLDFPFYPVAEHRE